MCVLWSELNGSMMGCGKWIKPERMYIAKANSLCLARTLTVSVRCCECVLWIILLFVCSLEYANWMGESDRDGEQSWKMVTPSFARWKKNQQSSQLNDSLQHFIVSVLFWRLFQLFLHYEYHELMRILLIFGVTHTKKHANYFSECHFLTCICTEPRIRPFCISRYQTNKLFAEWKTFKTSKPIAIWLQRKRYDTNFVLSIDCAHFSSSHSECIPSTYIFLVKNESGCFLRDSEFIDFQLAYWERTFFPDSPRQYDSSLSIVVNVMHSKWNGFIYRHPLNHLQMWGKTNWNYIISWTNSFQSIHRRLLFA